MKKNENVWNPILSSFVLISIVRGINWMHESENHEALHRNHCSCVWGSGTEAGIILP